MIYRPTDNRHEREDHVTSNRGICIIVKFAAILKTTNTHTRARMKRETYNKNKANIVEREEVNRIRPAKRSLQTSSLAFMRHYGYIQRTVKRKPVNARSGDDTGSLFFFLPPPTSRASRGES